MPNSEGQDNLSARACIATSSIQRSRGWLSPWRAWAARAARQHIAFGLTTCAAQTGGHVTDSADVSDEPGKNTPVPAAAISENAVDKTRAWTGLCVVVGGDVAITVAVAIALIKSAGSASNASTAVLASILSSAFAAIGTMTTAYFGIRASSNTAQRSIKHHADAAANRSGNSGA